MEISRPVTQREAESPRFRMWATRLKEVPSYHRKLWEFAFICDVLERNDMLRKGREGLGFAVGREPLTSYFTSQGVNVLATDMPAVLAQKTGWDKSGQWAGNKWNTYREDLIDRTTFDWSVDFMHVDMNRVNGGLLEGKFDFTWSCGSFEHLGSIEAGLQFIVNHMACLKPGGLAVHTTEFNVCSNDGTIEQEDVVVFRRRDLQDLTIRLLEAGHDVRLGFDCGGDPLDYWVDHPPYSPTTHLKLYVPGRPEGAVTTSYGLVIQKGAA